jgi:hypothetical protein
VPTLLYVLAGCWSVLAIIAVLLIKNKPNSVETETNNTVQQTEIDVNIT